MDHKNCTTSMKHFPRSNNNNNNNNNN